MTAPGTTIRSFAQWLAPLVPELAAGLAPLAERLSHALGEMPARSEPGAAEPNGLSGLGRRGPYERLLLTEWALAEEVPEEFLRRAAGSEHLFLQLDREEPRAGRRCVVWFDAGPEQVGGPRLAHLALLVVFARRAEQAGAALVWGVLQSPGPAQTGVSGPSFTTLLASRTGRTPSREDHARWAAELGLTDRDERWIVGGPGSARGAVGSPAVLEIAESFLEGDDELSVTVRCGARPIRTLRLPLPPPDVRTRLLRQPLAPTAPAPAPAAPPPRRKKSQWGPLLPELAFASDGHRLLGRQEDGVVVAIRVPGMPDEHRKPRLLRPTQPGQGVVAMGWARRTPVVLREVGGGHRLEGGRYHHTWPGPTLALPARPGPLVVTSEARLDVVSFLDGEGRRWRWVPGSTPESAPSALALGRRDGRVVEVFSDGTSTRVLLRKVTGPLELVVASGASRAFVGSAGGNGGVGTVLLDDGASWVFSPVAAGGAHPRRHPALPGAAVHGCWGDWQQRGVVYERDGRLFSVMLEPAVSEVQILPTGGRVVACVVSPRHYSRLVAWMEEDGRIVFHDLRDGSSIGVAP